MEHDIIASEAVNTGILFGILGLTTGSLWARATWGAFWTADATLNGAAITLLTYLAYIVLRGSINEEQKRAKISAIYNIFAYILLIVFLMIYPRLHNVDTLHPGKGGNPGFNTYDLDSHLRLVFYPAIIGWILLGTWMLTIRIRIQKLKRNLFYNEN